MGTNYYVVKRSPTVYGRVYHIGKSSMGWLFNFQTQNEKWSEPPVVWNNFYQLREWLKKYTVDNDEFVIMDEYNDIISYKDFIDIVERKQKDELCMRNPDNFKYSNNVDGYRFTDDEFC